ncbi:MAG: A/G-specific adenine glycosylase [Clostridiales bacterium]|nr:A/G-specific adenine glycosylase [Clostridiales bacterium]
MDLEEWLRPAVFPLISWFHDNARELPWRSDPTPYRVWVSEIMLQQTRVAAVLGYFARFMAALPTVEALADAEEDELLKLWQGLGYYNRARNLKKAARQIVYDRGDVFPDTYRELLTLAGVGEYTAGAIASIAFGEAVPAVDGNVLRVVTRLTGDTGDITKPETKARIRAALAAVMPQNLSGAFNQALMELGALVCLPNGAPECDRCPWRELCAARREGTIDDLPVKPPKKQRKVEGRTVYLIFREGKVALRRRPDEGLLRGLWEFPNVMDDQEDALAQWGMADAATLDGPRARHIFTHIEWYMQSVQVFPSGEALPEGWVWADRAALEERYPIPNAFDGFRACVEGQLRQTESRKAWEP